MLGSFSERKTHKEEDQQNSSELRTICTQHMLLQIQCQALVAIVFLLSPTDLINLNFL